MDKDYKIVTCISATTKTKPLDCLNHNDIEFTLNNLNSMCDRINNNSIYIQTGFQGNPIGWVLAAKVIDDMLHIECKVEKTLFPLYIIPGFQVLDAGFYGGKLQYKDIRLVVMGTTITSSDDGCTIFKAGLLNG